MFNVLRHSLSPSNLLSCIKVHHVSFLKQNQAWNMVSHVPLSSKFFGTFRSLGPALAERTLQIFRQRGSELCYNEESSMPLPTGPFFIQSRGMKYKGKVKRRCKDCFLRWIDGQLFNLCSARPRHKHALKMPYYANQRLLTHATMGPHRKW